MVHRVLRAMSGAFRGHPYVRVFGLLLVTALALVAVSALSWCDEFEEGCDLACSCKAQSSRTTAEVPTVTGSASIQTYPDAVHHAHEGEEVWQQLSFGGQGNVTHVTLIYIPPAGATGLKFNDPQPTGPHPDGSYRWENIPVQQSERGWVAKVSTWHNAPQVLPEGTQLRATSALIARLGKEEQTVMQEYIVDRGQPPKDRPRTLSIADTPVQVGQQSAGYYLWHTHAWAAPAGVWLTTDECQEWADLLESEDVFLGVRFPLLDATPPYTESYALPVVFSSEYSPTISLVDQSAWPWTTFMKANLEYKPKYHTFLNNALPQVDNERWFAIGIDDDLALTCPGGLNIPSGDWQIKTEAWLDFGGEEADCANCVLPVYYCYEGQTAPPIPGAALGVLGMTVTAYQGWGITCIGPHLLWLAPLDTVAHSFHIHFAGSATAQPSETVTFTHSIWNMGDRVTVTLSVTSTLDGAWNLYDTADPPEPVTQPIQVGRIGVPGDPPSEFDFQIVGQIPAGAQGAHVVYVTATDAANPSQKTETTDLLWVGEWEAPPPFKVFFPVVMRR